MIAVIQSQLDLEAPAVSSGASYLSTSRRQPLPKQRNVEQTLEA